MKKTLAALFIFFLFSCSPPRLSRTAVIYLKDGSQIYIRTVGKNGEIIWKRLPEPNLSK